MMDPVSGFQNSVWRIIGYDGAETIFETEVPQADLSVEGVTRLLQLLVAGDLEMGDIFEAATGKSRLLEVRPDLDSANRLMFMAGENPHYVASLWRGDELPA